MSLHNEIMNIPAIVEKGETAAGQLGELAYKAGHREALLAAAELAQKYDALVERLLNALERHNADDYVDSIREEYSLYE